MHLVIMLRHWESLHFYTCKDSGKLCMQSVPITTKVVSSNPVHGKLYLIQRYEIEVVNHLRQVGGFLQELWFSPPIKLIATILLKVALNTKTPTPLKLKEYQSTIH